MDIYNGLCFERIVENDIQSMTKIMKRAFDEDAKRHLGEECGGPPGYDNGDFIRQYYFQDKAEAYKILKDSNIIGGIVVFISENGENYLGNMFIDPLCQDKGMGTTVWKYIEQKYPNTTKWKTDTPGFSKRNHNFYVNKCGFKIIKIENPKDKYKESYIMEKIM